MGRHFGRAFVMFGPLTRLPLCHVANCADCLVAIVDNPAAINQTFNLVDGDNVRVWRYLREYTRRTGIRAFLVPIPYVIGYGIAELASVTSHILFGKKGRLPSLLTPRRFESQFKPLRFSNKKLAQTLKWHPPLNFGQCLKLTYG
jgi:nucleoside-diphosphate-sugar epimerase